MMRNLILVFCSVILLGACTAAKKDVDKSALPAHLVDSDAGTMMATGEKVENITRSHNQQIPVSINEEYSVKHTITNVGGKSTGIDVGFKTDSDTLQPESVSVIFSPPGDKEPEAKQTSGTAQFVQVSPGVWSASIADTPFGNDWTININVTCKALKEGTGISRIDVVPIGGVSTGTAASFEDNHSALGG